MNSSIYIDIFDVLFCNLHRYYSFVFYCYALLQTFCSKMTRLYVRKIMVF